MQAILLFRLSQRAWRVPLFRPVALLLQARAIRVAGAEIHPAATIGPGLMLLHSVGIVVGHQVVAGRDLVISQGVTLGHRRGDGQPVLGDRVRLMVGSMILGAVSVGDDTVVAAGAVVLEDVPAGHVAVGVPARSLPMQQAPPPPVVGTSGG